MLPFQASPPEPISLLVVEDDSTARELTSLSLGFRFPFLLLYQAGNGAEGVALYEKHRPDIVLTDLNMPVMDGISLAQHILAQDENAQIILVSGQSESPQLLQSIPLDIKQHVMKPIEHELLFAAVWGCVQGVNRQRKLQEQER